MELIEELEAVRDLLRQSLAENAALIRMINEQRAVITALVAPKGATLPDDVMNLLPADLRNEFSV